MMAKDEEAEKGPGGFWAFSTALYARPGVEPALLAAQDRHGLDVNCLLFCIYAGVLGFLLGDAQISALLRIDEIWGQGVVRPLREARRRLKPLLPGAMSGSGTTSDIAALREEVKRLELDAERLMQAELETLVAADGRAEGSREVAGKNLAGWLKAQNLALTEERRRLLDAVLAAAFG